MIDCSFGIIPYRLGPEGILFLLVWENYGDGHWNFPKGHRDGKEHPIETALRELREETGLVPQKIISVEPFVHEYSFEHKGEIIHRHLEYFVGLMGDDEVKLQLDEVGQFRWMTLNQLINETPFPELQRLAQAAHKLIIELRG